MLQTMKNLLKLLSLSLIFVGFCSSAQPKIIREDFYSDVEVAFKRCVATGNSAIIDLVFTNYTGKAISPRLEYNEPCNGNKTLLYDDEGNVYKWSNMSITFGGEKDLYGSGDIVALLPTEVPVAMRIKINNVNEYATEFSTLRLQFRGISDRAYGIALLEIKHIPITRKD